MKLNQIVTAVDEYLVKYDAGKYPRDAKVSAIKEYIDALRKYDGDLELETAVLSQDILQNELTHYLHNIFIQLDQLGLLTKNNINIVLQKFSSDFYDTHRYVFNVIRILASEKLTLSQERFNTFFLNLSPQALMLCYIGIQSLSEEKKLDQSSLNDLLDCSPIWDKFCISQLKSLLYYSFTSEGMSKFFIELTKTSRAYETSFELMKEEIAPLIEALFKSIKTDEESKTPQASSFGTNRSTESIELETMSTDKSTQISASFQPVLAKTDPVKVAADEEMDEERASLYSYSPSFVRKD